jgi:periplasmic divalent cation tolerance protein
VDQALVLITCGSAEESRTIARRLVEQRLAAGVQMLPIETIYTWAGEVVEDDEVLLICKTRRDRYGEIESIVRRMH